MKDIVSLSKQISIDTRIPEVKDISFSELVDLNEEQAKQECFGEIISKIKSGKRYMLSTILSAIDSYQNILKETLEFKLFELEDKDIVSKPEM